ncbi:hypothetical protein LTR84_005378 [Exophiala bonariae]|uniref:SH3 domain-containing protein n=1 Tax=Exophiala bonariae TaxID=1690606 RepID=A0AAV9N6J1_9EURO|nr:hypothetical protein LTR84_005378 [Exophiala bonariae]
MTIFPKPIRMAQSTEAAQGEAELSSAPSSIHRSQIMTPSSSTAITMSDWSGDDSPSPTESEFHVPERWNAPEDDIRSFLASYYQNEDASQNDVNDGLSVDNFYEYEPAFKKGDYVRILGQQDSKLAEKNTMGSYWSKMPYQITASRMGHEYLDFDEDEDKRSEEYYDNGNQINSIRNAEWLKGRAQSEIEKLLDEDMWYYRLYMSGSTEFPVADAMW